MYRALLLPASRRSGCTGTLYPHSRALLLRRSGDPACFWARLASTVGKADTVDSRSSDETSPRVPWYLSNNEPSAQAAGINLPDLPANPPSGLEVLTRYLATDLGLRELEILDGRTKESALGSAIIIVGTGKSKKHLSKAASELLVWLKHRFGRVPDQEGILTANFVRVARRRETRKAQRQRYFESTYAKSSDPDGDSSLAKTGDWVAVNTHFSNIYVHLLTSARRKELVLSELFTADTAPASEASSAQFDADYIEPPAAIVAEVPDEPARVPAGRRRFHSIAYPRSLATVTQSIPNGNHLVPFRQAITRLQDECNMELTMESAEVSRFLAAFPPVLSQDHWRVRLEYLAMAVITSDAFPLAALEQHVALQMASGYAVDTTDANMILEAIAYHQQSRFEKRGVDEQSKADWAQLCDEKSRHILKIHDLVFRSTGKSMLQDSQSVALLFRTFVCPSVSSISAMDALSDPNPAGPASVFHDNRATAFRSLLVESDAIIEPQILTMVLTLLLNRNLWTPFWSLINRVSMLVRLEQAVLEAITAMVVKTGEEKQISHLVNRFLPSFYGRHELHITESLTRSLKAALDLIDPESKSNPTARKLISSHP